MESDLKRAVSEFWDAGSCGEVYAVGSTMAQSLDAQAAERYRLEPYIHEFAQFENGSGQDVLEVGVGMGADHFEWAKSQPRLLIGVDLTPRAIAFTRTRLIHAQKPDRLAVSDGERLPFKENSFDIVYSWGVLHHSPDTPTAIKDVHRVLRPGGQARIMIYHTKSIVGYLLWLRYGLLRGRPWRSLEDIYANHLESPGTKAYSVRQADALFKNFSNVSIQTQLAFGDLLEGAVGQRHQGPLLSLAKAIWPRSLIKRFLPGHGLLLLVVATK